MIIKEVLYHPNYYSCLCIKIITKLIRFRENFKIQSNVFFHRKITKSIMSEIKSQHIITT